MYVCVGSSLLLVNSSESSDCEDHESDYLHHHHQDLARQHQERLAVARPPPGSPRNHSTERPTSSAHSHHDPFSNKSVAGSDVVDELLKPLQSYFNVFRTGLYDHSHGGHQHPHHPHHQQHPHHQAGVPGDGGDLANNGGPPAHNTRSHDKRYKIKKNQSITDAGVSLSGGPAAGRKRQDGSGSGGCVAENGIVGGSHQQQHPHMGGPPPHADRHPMMGGLHQQQHHHHHQQGPPPSTTANGYSVTTAGYTVTTNGYPLTTNGYTVTTAGGGGPPQRLDSLETEIAHHQHHHHHQPPPNMAEPPPGHPPFPPPPHQLLMLPPAMVGPPPGLLSPTVQHQVPQQPLYSTPLKEVELAGGKVIRRDSQEQLEMDISNMSLQDTEASRQVRVKRL